MIRSITYYHTERDICKIHNKYIIYECCSVVLLLLVLLLLEEENSIELNLEI